VLPVHLDVAGEDVHELLQHLGDLGRLVIEVRRTQPRHFVLPIAEEVVEYQQVYLHDVGEGGNFFPRNVGLLFKKGVGGLPSKSMAVGFQKRCVQRGVLHREANWELDHTNTDRRFVNAGRFIFLCKCMHFYGTDHS
jgi:hypothetical protein